MFELRRAAAPASSFSYRSIDELYSLEVVTEVMSQRLRSGSSFDVPTGIASVSFVNEIHAVNARTYCGLAFREA